MELPWEAPKEDRLDVVILADHLLCHCRVHVWRAPTPWRDAVVFPIDGFFSCTVHFQESSSGTRTTGPMPMEALLPG
eukprot:10413086-Lingulodinium_polyedra.AAC.1